MSKRFLDEVVKQIVRETKIDSEKEEIHFQFLPLDEIYGTNTFHVPYFDLLTIYNFNLHRLVINSVRYFFSN